MKKISRGVRDAVFYGAWILFMFLLLGNWNLFYGVSRASFFLLSYVRTVHVARVSCGELTVDIYREKDIGLRHEDALQTTVVDAYNELPRYLKIYYSYFSDSEEPMFKRVPSRVKIVILSEATYALYDQTLAIDGKAHNEKKKHQKQTINTDIITLGMHSGPLKTIYVRGSGNEFDAIEMENERTVRHELFHHFYYAYDLGAVINEWDAYEFGDEARVERR
ncbi:MAG: hypothetical protein HZA35_02895 [Parcubacteria group bacterium]|nr:hypothetical protein [Parcubacteria group bacterium]